MGLAEIAEIAERRARTVTHLAAFGGLDEAGARALAAELNLMIKVYPAAIRARNMDLRSDRVRVSIGPNGRVVSATAG